MQVQDALLRVRGRLAGPQAPKSIPKGGRSWGKRKAGY